LEFVRHRLRPSRVAPEVDRRKDLTILDEDEGRERESPLDFGLEKLYYTAMTTIMEVAAAKLADLVKQVQAGNDVLLTEGDIPVARLVPARETDAVHGTALRIRTLKGHQVLASAVSQGELAEELFGHS
jgi:prevent-host-death family protein